MTNAETYTVTNQNVAPQIGALKAAGCQVVVAATVPGFTALALGTAAQLGFQPQWVVSNVGADYATVAGLLTAKGAPLLEGVISDNYLPNAADTANPWIKLFQKINQQYNGSAPWDGNVEYGMAVGLHLRPGAEGRRPEPDPQVADRGGREGRLHRAGPGAVRVLVDQPLRLHRRAAGQGQPRASDTFFGPIYTTDSGTGAVTEYTGHAGNTTRQRHSELIASRLSLRTRSAPMRSDAAVVMILQHRGRGSGPVAWMQLTLARTSDRWRPADAPGRGAAVARGGRRRPRLDSDSIHRTGSGMLVVRSRRRRVEGRWLREPGSTAGPRDRSARGPRSWTPTSPCSTAGDLQPTGERIADAAGVSLRTLWTNFKDMETLFAGGRRAPDRDCRTPSTSRSTRDCRCAERVEAFCEQRARMLEIIAPAARAAATREPFSSQLQLNRTIQLDRSRIELDEVFPGRARGRRLSPRRSGQTPCWP